MAVDTFNRIKSDLPNFPDDALRSWIVPMSEEGDGYDWPPPVGMGNWRYVLTRKSLDFWRKTEWRLDDVSLALDSLQPSIQDSVSGILMAHIAGKQNAYSNIVGGKERLFRLIRYIRDNRVVPVPVILLAGQPLPKVIDGHHRIAALTYLRLYATNLESESAIADSAFAPPTEFQPAWIVTAPSEGTYVPDPVIAKEDAEIQRQWDSIPASRPLVLPGFPKRPKS